MVLADDAEIAGDSVADVAASHYLRYNRYAVQHAGASCCLSYAIEPLRHF